MTEPKQCVLFLRQPTCDALPDGGTQLRNVISLEINRSYPNGHLLFWKHIDGGWELVDE